MLNLFKKKKEAKKKDFWSAMTELDKLGQQAAKASANEFAKNYYEKEVSMDIIRSNASKAV